MNFLYRKISFVEFYKRRIVENIAFVAMPGILFYICVDLFLLFFIFVILKFVILNWIIWS